jgi:hypothetical protein
MSGSTTFNATGTVQTFTATTAGLYDITADGAQGGNGQTTTGGDGAEAGGEIALTQGETLTIIVGQQGRNGTSAGGGGGGGSFVIDPHGSALVVAGGGGGAGDGYGQAGQAGQTGTSGGDGGSLVY